MAFASIGKLNRNGVPISVQHEAFSDLLLICLKLVGREPLLGVLLGRHISPHDSFKEEIFVLLRCAAAGKHGLHAVEELLHIHAGLLPVSVAHLIDIRRFLKAIGLILDFRVGEIRFGDAKNSAEPAEIQPARFDRIRFIF